MADLKGAADALKPDTEITDRLKQEAQAYMAAQVTRILTGVGRKLGESTVKLNDIAEGNSPGFAKLALDGGRKLAEGKGPMRSAVELGAGHLKDKAKDTFSGLFGGKGKRKKGGGGGKPVIILETIDVGVPVRVAYDQWTRYEDFSTFAKGVKSATTADDTTSDWKLKVFWSNRSWKAHTTQQVPDARISWTSEGAKGTTKGVVTFHPLGDNITRVLLVIEYYPKGLFEKTGNIWRAQGRRARLDLKNYARHISMKGDIDDGWRGSIEDGEVVKTHEDALAEEEEARAEEEGREEGHEEDHEDGHEAAASDSEADSDSDSDGDRPEGEYEEEEAEEGDEERDHEAEYDEADEGDDHDPEAEYDEDGAEEEGEPEAEYEDAEEEDPEAEYEDAELVEDEGDDEDADTRKQREYADSGDRGRR
ncbi:SRPBCC family protein [Streptomyces sp. NBC_00237]|uniref:SRPBCC family protein n=1 Tax=Streptomyces sp. NBC_00237 TaxID=2975687 RepID=UPI00224E052C|nr:SRPBCC family protein [Streptomyces sp. NBC_00237]MCX5203056.1 SRPBCC family protein [Streptomyces sp. NBC_00237]